MNEETMSINYGTRFMLTDNTIYPKVYEVTKVMDTFPLGCQKIVLAQSHYNEHTDLCEAIDLTEYGIANIDDSKMHYICDYYKSSLKPIEEENTQSGEVIWCLNKVNDKLYIDGQPITVQAVPNVDTLSNCEWHIFIDNVEYVKDDASGLYEDLVSYIDITFDDVSHSLTIAAINKDLAKYIVKIAIYDDVRTYYDFVEMEVVE